MKQPSPRHSAAAGNPIYRVRSSSSAQVGHSCCLLACQMLACQFGNRLFPWVLSACIDILDILTSSASSQHELKLFKTPNCIGLAIVPCVKFALSMCLW